MEILKYILLGIDGILCLVIIALMLLQAGKGAGSSIMGGDSSDSSDGYLFYHFQQIYLLHILYVHYLYLMYQML